MGTQRRRKLRTAATIGAVVSLVMGSSTAQAAPNPAAAAAGPTLSVNVSTARHAISPDVYGMNGGDPAFVAETRPQAATTSSSAACALPAPPGPSPKTAGSPAQCHAR